MSSDATGIALAAIAAFLPFLLSLAAAFRPNVKPGSARQFFLYEGGIDTGKFVTGSVGYSMQVASIYLFLYWFPTYGPWTLIVPVAWLGGYYLIAALVVRKKLDSLLTFRSETVVTIHGFVGEAFGGRKLLPMLLGATTVIGLAGTMLGEIDYALTNYVFPALTVKPPVGPAAVFLFTTVLLTAGSYIMWGGFRAAIDTDVFQVKVAYIVIGVLIGALLVDASKAGHLGLAFVVGGAVIVFCLLAARGRVQLRRMDPNYETSRLDSWIFLVFALTVAGALIFAWVQTATRQTPVPVGRDVLSYTSTLPWGFGVLGAIALFVTNFVWQLVDVSSLQRLQSIQFDANSDEPGMSKAVAERAKLATGLRAAAWEGTGSWALIIVIAVLVKAVGSENVLDALKSHWLLTPLFIYVVIAFMLSTLDTLIAASGYVFHYDFTHRFLPSDQRTPQVELKWARAGTMGCLIVVGGIYFLIRQSYGNDNTRLASIIYAIYAIQASILGPILVALFMRRKNLAFCFLGLLAGWITAGFTTVVWTEPRFGIAADSWYVLPPFVALTSSAVISWLGCFFPNRALLFIGKAHTGSTVGVNDEMTPVE